MPRSMVPGWSSSPNVETYQRLNSADASRASPPYAELRKMLTKSTASPVSSALRNQVSYDIPSRARALGSRHGAAGGTLAAAWPMRASAMPMSGRARRSGGVCPANRLALPSRT